MERQPASTMEDAEDAEDDQHDDVKLAADPCTDEGDVAMCGELSRTATEVDCEPGEGSTEKRTRSRLMATRQAAWDLRPVLVELD